MLRFWIAFFAFLVAAGSSTAYFMRPPNSDDRSGFNTDEATWAPAPTEIRRLSGATGTDPNTADGRAIRNRFSQLFKDRYRGHSPMMAVGMRFRRNSVDLMTPARMEPWNMDRLAIQLYNETRQDFGHPFDVDLYITFIGSPPLKIGTLRQDASGQDKVQIVHFARPILPGEPDPTQRQGSHETARNSSHPNI